MKPLEMALWFLLAFLAGYAWYSLYSGGTTFLGGVASNALSWTDCVYGYLGTLLGVLSGATYRALHPSGREQQITDFKKFLRGLLRSRDLWAGIVASPLVFGLIYRTVDGITVSGLLVVALENGFCCHAVIARAQRRAR